MLALLDSAMPFLQLPLIALALGCWGFAFVRQWKRRRTRGPRGSWSPSEFIAIGAFLGVIAFEFGLTTLYKCQASTEIADFFAGGIQSVAVDGTPFAVTDDFVAQIKDPRHLFAHHSHPTKALHVRLTGANGTLDVVLSRDSGDRHEYWLLYPRYSMTASNDVGRVITNRLDAL